MLNLRVLIAFINKVAPETKNTWAESLNKTIDPSKCPICSEPNQCAQEVAKATCKTPEACWCMTTTFSAELLAQVPAEAVKKACICARCTSKF